jgi:hypothetical protein
MCARAVLPISYLSLVRLRAEIDPASADAQLLGAGANHRMLLLVFEDGRIAAARQSVGAVLLFELSGNATALRATVASIRQRPPSGERTGS